MNAKDADWPSLPPIRTSSYNARVSCETLNLQTSPPYAHAHTTSNTPLSTSGHIAKPASAKPASKSADASPQGTSSPTSHIFSCFPHRFIKGHRHDGGKRGTFDAGRLFRSMFGPVVPRYSTHMSAYTGGVSTPPSRGAPSSMSNSPSGRMKTPGTATSPINLMRSGGSTPHAGAVLRASKGHAGHAFTMMPPDVVGKKKPPDYESDEPKSPEVTCIGKVRRKHCKATWDALVKDNGKKKKGKAKRLSGEMSRMSGELVRNAADGEKKMEGSELTVAAKLSKQRSERRQSRDLEGFSTDLDVGVRKRGEVQDGCNAKAFVEPGNEDPHSHATEGAADDLFASSIPSTEDIRVHDGMPSRGESAHNEEPVASSSGATEVPPSNCLLLMKKGSRNRSAHYPSDGIAGSQWNWGQVLT